MEKRMPGVKDALPEAAERLSEVKERVPEPGYRGRGTTFDVPESENALPDLKTGCRCQKTRCQAG